MNEDDFIDGVECIIAKYLPSIPRGLLGAIALEIEELYKKELQRGRMTELVDVPDSRKAVLS